MQVTPNIGSVYELVRNDRYKARVVLSVVQVHFQYIHSIHTIVVLFSQSFGGNAVPLFLYRTAGQDRSDFIKTDQSRPHPFETRSRYAYKELGRHKLKGG